MAASFAGRWNLTVRRPDLTFPSWVELTPTASGWEGRFVGIWGSARPITTIVIDGTTLKFSLPPQYEGFPTDMSFEAELSGESLSGTTHDAEGNPVPFEGVRAPELPAKPNPVWGEPIELIGADLSGWLPRVPGMESFWTVDGGDLVNTDKGTDIYTERTFGDFHLVAEYSYPKDSNSGIYLRGRYELQVLDDHGQPPSVGSSGAIYGFLVPSVNAVKPFGERNVAEITLLGRYVTVVLNGVTIHDHLEIPGITGAALESAEGEPGPILIQGDHGPVTFHRLTIRERID